jgi:hypothetical protein
MNCTEFHDLLQRRLDGDTIAERGEIATHAAACADCRAWLAVVQRLETSLHALPRPILPIGSADKIVASVLADQRARRWQRYTVRTVGAMAAAVLIAVLLGQWMGKREPDGAVSSISRSAQVVQATVPQREQERIGPSLRESVTGVAQLTIHTADETVRTFLPDTRANDPKPSPLTASVTSLREAGNSVTTGLEPVADSAKRALNLFLREVPPSRKNDKRGS